MTRKEAIEILKLHEPFMGGIEQQKLTEALNMSIEVLKVIDDIKAEIEELKPHSHYTQEMKDKVLEIIDRHMKEVE